METRSTDRLIQSLSKILVVEDDNTIADYICILLKDLYHTRIAKNGEEALKIVREWLPDLVISDIMMPKRDGLSLCQEIKSNKRTAGIPIILLSVLTNRDDILKGWEVGADEYLFKPFHPKELLVRIKSMLSIAQTRKEIERIKIQTEKIAMVGQLSGGIAHEFNNPLGVILGFAQSALRRMKEDDPLFSSLQYIEREAKRCKNLVKDLLTFSRMENDRKRKMELESHH